jgi:sodium-dependent dicarboxylate transporter 2/3/5
MSGFMIALAMERWGLHKRIALRLVSVIGTKPRQIVAGFMISSALLSMWISNTATSLMMLPIGLSVVGLIERPGGTEHSANFGLALLLGVAYACSVGGMATLIGTPTNAILAGFLQDTYGFEISFARWMAVGLPMALVGVGVVFLVLTRLVFPIRITELPGGRAYIHGQLAELGPMRREEKAVSIVFGLTAALWVTRPLVQPFVPGLSDAGVGIGGALLLFIIPVDLKRGVFVLDWAWAKRLPWGVLLLFGGGLSLAAAVSSTGLAEWIGASMSGLSAWPVLMITLLIVAVIVLLTELTSNAATATAFLPILASIALGIGQNPLLLLVPATLAASCAFMLPVATPPNAIIYGSGKVTIPQMARAGAYLNVIFALLVTLLTFTLLPAVFDIDFGVLPPWSTANP